MTPVPPHGRTGSSQDRRRGPGCAATLRARGGPMLRCMLVVAFAVAAAAPSRAQSQAPWNGENLQYFPKDISRERLTQRMREFSFALGVRCQYCHAGGDGVSFEG